ncbi:MAG: tRNA (adenosine(37)-N6)-threonylcarbamoyltransferase complex transferase subunit TsaD [Candidatus Omnitrophica bacterium]|nr:tRNA (adenosine(37)-N6)-threonylcarbamoyltransferase complex transferase subunit TsaD [Candidatus Omnitrophota bacterium]
MVTLGIETSCDETAAAIVVDGAVLSSRVSSSVHLHAKYGGVVPEIASRYHVEYISRVCKLALKDAGKKLEDIDLVAVTETPGLPGSLLVGIAFAKAVGFAGNIPVIGVNHVDAHILSCFLDNKDALAPFPFLGVVVSGGHTSIYHCKSLEDFHLIGRTKDDAAGEAFDKIAKMLGLGYPGGLIVEKRAAKFKGKDEIHFPRALLKGSRDNIDFSFSGIKTAVMYYWRSSSKTEKEKTKICFSFQEAIIDVIEKKISRALKLTGVKRLALGGGVVNNALLRGRLKALLEKKRIELYLPKKEYCGDNAAMVAFLGEKYFKYGKKKKHFLNEVV